MRVQRYGQIIRLRPERYDEYKQLHAEPWPEVRDRISAVPPELNAVYGSASQGATRSVTMRCSGIWPARPRDVIS